MAVHSPSVVSDFKSITQRFKFILAEMYTQFLENISEFLLADEAGAVDIKTKEFLP